ncbi:hypothetical protein AB0G79_16035 [Streptomyces sp. NPDC020807]|uniref:hypothetical protein n=1 Tax=Streptomyces sp. NPDC020807 TaxID=3155119 RepID=UPI0033F2BFE9
MISLFRPADSEDEFSRAVAEFLADGGGPVPVWTGGRPDLVASLDLAAGLYSSPRRPPVCEAGVVVGELPASIREFARPAARSWTTGAAGVRLPVSGSLLILGRYENLTMAAIGPALVEAYRTGRDVFLLTGRDPQSISWAVAKQYAAVAADGATGLFTDLDTQPLPSPVPAGDEPVYLDARTVGGADLTRIASERIWKRVLVSGHGTEDSINLGAHTVCGLSPVARPGQPGPSCAHGRGCHKPEDKLVPAHRMRTAELVLGGCDSGALADLATYGPDHQLLLNAIDGPAQTVVAGISMHQSARVENLRWLEAAEGDGATARLLNTALLTMHPYPSFVQAGLPSSAYPHAVPADAGRSRPDRPAPADRPAGSVHALAARAHAFLLPGMLSAAHPLRAEFERLGELIEAGAVRTVTGLAGPRAEFLRAAEQGGTDLDAAIARRLAERPDDPLSEFPRYFGDRSRVDPAEAVNPPCVLCGRPAWQYPRHGFTPRIPLTTAHVCLSCGPVGYWMDGGPRLHSRADPTVTAGGTLRIEATVAPERPGPVQVGLLLPWHVRAAISPPVHSLPAGGAGPVVFEVRFDPSAPPQEHHYTVFGVQDLALSLLRCPFAVLPPGEA